MIYIFYYANDNKTHSVCSSVLQRLRNNYRQDATMITNQVVKHINIDCNSINRFADDLRWAYGNSDNILFIPKELKEGLFKNYWEHYYRHKPSPNNKNVYLYDKKRFYEREYKSVYEAAESCYLRLIELVDGYVVTGNGCIKKVSVKRMLSHQLRFHTKEQVIVHLKNQIVNEERDIANAQYLLNIKARDTTALMLKEFEGV